MEEYENIFNPNQKILALWSISKVRRQEKLLLLVAENEFKISRLLRRSKFLMLLPCLSLDYARDDKGPTTDLLYTFDFDFNFD